MAICRSSAGDDCDIEIASGMILRLIKLGEELYALYRNGAVPISRVQTRLHASSSA